MHAAQPRRVAVVGAGAAGLSAARALQARGVAVTVFDKGRKPGGRISLRETAHGGFDHGALCVDVGGSVFNAELARLTGFGLLAPWSEHSSAGRASAWVAVPTMHALAQHWAKSLEVHCAQHVETIEPQGEGWRLRLRDDEQARDFDAVIVTVPQPQLQALLPAIALPAALASIAYDPCWTLLWTPLTAPPLQSNAHLHFTDHPILASITREDLKPGRAGPVRYVVHATAEWSQQHLEQSAEVAAALLQDAAAQVLGISTEASYLAAHRWRYARVRTPLGLPQLTLAPGLHYASDGCLGDGIESAMISGAAAAEALLAAA